jgi:hypothetical protein
MQERANKEVRMKITVETAVNIMQWNAPQDDWHTTQAAVDRAVLVKQTFGRHVDIKHRV